MTAPQPRPRSNFIIARHDSEARKAYPIGRMGITETEKRPGDKIWCPRSREWKTVT